MLRVFSEKLNASTVSVNIGPEAFVAGWKVACLISGGPWLDDLRDCWDLYKGSQGRWEIGIPMVQEGLSTFAAWQVPARPKEADVEGRVPGQGSCFLTVFSEGGKQNSKLPRSSTTLSSC